jgi:DNA-binding MarR family transcriptional regulator
MPTKTSAAKPDPVAAYVEQWAAVRPDLDASPLLVLGRINRIDALVDAVLRPPFAAEGLANGDFDLLAALRRAGAPYTLSSTALAQRMLVTNGAATKRIDRLEARGLVTRSVSPSDGRGRDIRLTDVGLELTDRLITQHFDNERAILAALSPGERDRLGELLGKLLATVEPTD